MEPVMEINVTTYEAQSVVSAGRTVVMIPFSASAQGELFTGSTAENGCDTQNIFPDGRMSLSARYMLSGKDRDGNDCRVFIENNGDSLDNCTPVIFTDSPVLAFLQDAKLHAAVECVQNGVIVRIYVC